MKTEVTNPQLGSIINLAHWVEDGSTCVTSAEHRFVLDRGQIRALFQRLVQACQRYHEPRRLYPTRRPYVPCEPYAVPIFILLHKLLVRRHNADLQKKYQQKYNVALRHIILPKNITSTYQTNMRRLETNHIRNISL